MSKWIEVEPGAPFPDEVPPWAERHELVKRPGLPDAYRRVARAAGVALLVGGVATTVFAGTGGAGFAPLYAALGALAGLVLLYVGLIGVPPREMFVPSASGRYVEVAPEPVDPAVLDGPRKQVLGCTLFMGVAFAAAIVVVLTVGYREGHSLVETLRGWLPILSPMEVFLVPPVVNAVERRLKSEAEVSERFLHVADPRAALAPPTPPAPPADAPGEHG